MFITGNGSYDHNGEKQGDVNYFLGGLFGKKDQEEKYKDACGLAPKKEDYVIHPNSTNSEAKLDEEEYEKAVKKYKSCIDAQKQEKLDKIEDSATTVKNVVDIFTGKKAIDYNYSTSEDSEEEAKKKRMKNIIIISSIVFVLIIVGYFMYKKNK